MIFGTKIQIHNFVIFFKLIFGRNSRFSNSVMTEKNGKQFFDCTFVCISQFYALYKDKVSFYILQVLQYMSTIKAAVFFSR